MGVINNFVSDRFIPKEKTPFYVDTMNIVSCSIEEVKTESESEFALLIKQGKDEYILRIKSYKYGIFNLSLDLKDPSIKYKNKVNIGKNLQPKIFKDIIKEKNAITLIIEDDLFENTENSKSEEINTYKIIINLVDFEIYYFINNILTLVFNGKKKCNLLNDPIKNIKPNIFDLEFINIDQCYGLPERPQKFYLNDDYIRLYNTDDCDQIVGDMSPTYGSIPMIHGVNKNFITTVFNDNCSENDIEIKTNNKNKNILWFTEGGIINLYLTSDTDYLNNSKKIAEITGYAIMPPLWVLGYHQCRYGYKNLDDVMNVAKKFNEYNIPIDCFWLDIEHTNEKRYFTWDPENFGKVKEFLDILRNEHKNFVTIIDPHIKVDENYSVCKILKENDCFVKGKNEKNELVDYIGNCWPGDSYYADFLNFDKVLQFYKDFYKTESYFFDFTNVGSWVDMNEPSVFGTKDKSMPKNNIHNDGKELVEHKEIHNIYGYYYHKVAYAALKSRLGENKRAFVLSRSFYAGSQENGYVWTGDQKSQFDFLHNSIETNMINGLCGISATGTDIGGFLFNPTTELVEAWYKFGIFYSFFRGHSDTSTIRREPWLFEKSVCDNIIKSINLRYNLLMYTYTKFYKHVKDGIPILKPMWMKFRNNYDEFIYQDQSSLFIFGDELIGCNHYVMTEYEADILKNKLGVPIYDLITGENIKNNFSVNKENMIQGLVIGGNIIPWTNDPKKCSFYVMSAPISFKIYVDDNNYAIGYYYFDDGISEVGEYIYLRIELKDKKLNIVNLNKNSELKNINEIIPILDKIEIFGYGETINSVEYNSKEIKSSYDSKINMNVFNLLAENIKIHNELELILKN